MRLVLAIGGLLGGMIILGPDQIPQMWRQINWNETEVVWFQYVV